MEKTQMKTAAINIKPPKFVQKLQPVVVETDSDVLLEGEVEGVPFPEIKWFYHEKELLNTEHYTIEEKNTKVTLKITSVTTSDIGIYTCQATNPGGVATSRTNVIVQGKCFEQNMNGIE